MNPFFSLPRALVVSFGTLLTMSVTLAADDTRERYIVSLAEPALASYVAQPPVTNAAGKTLSPTATAATGARRLDLKRAASVAYLDHLRAKQDALVAGAAKSLGRVPVVKARVAVIGNAVVLELDAAEAAAVRAMPGVVAVERDRVHPLLTDSGPRWIGAEPVWNGTVPDSTLRSRGEGIVVGVMDTGITPTHPSFADVSGDGYNHTNPRGRFFGVCVNTPSRCNDKLIGIWDMTNEDARVGADPDGHGTHVASTAAGNVFTASVPLVPVSATVSGVAPRANLIAYKVCQPPDNEPDGEVGCYESFMLEALEQSVSDGVDVMNASIGGDPVDPWAGVRSGTTDLAAAWLNVREAGIVPVIAAGNEGPGVSTVSGSSHVPWVIAVANATHDRIFGTLLAQISGPGIAPPFDLIGAGATSGLTRRRIVHARDFGNELCGTGTPQNLEPTGASNPFPPNTFHGEIVICVRGVYARVEKGYNVQRSGAGGMVLVNTETDAESIVTDSHYLPAVHLGYANAQRLLGALQGATDANGELTAEIVGASRIVDASLGDVLSSGSGRGPVIPNGGWLKPNVTAPGTDILAASNNGTGLALLSGTSMAAPHVAGAAAIVLGANPTWNVSQVESALESTAIGDVRLEDAVTPATPHAAGAGRVNLTDAVRANLYFEMNRQRFAQSDPRLGIDRPTTMDLPYFVAPRCATICTIGRTARATRAGTWRAELRVPAAANGTVTPAQFTLAAGATQDVVISFDQRDGALAGQWIYGEVALIPTTAGSVEQRLPVAVRVDGGAIPASIAITADANAGSRDVTVTGLVALPDAVFTAGDLALLTTQTQSVSADPASDNGDPYRNPANGGLVRTFTVGAGTFNLSVDAMASLDRGVDLYVGIDLNGNGIPEEDEELCAQRVGTGSEHCDVPSAALAGLSATWIYAHNVSGTTQTLTLRYAAIPEPGSADTDPLRPSLVATGPGHTGASESFPLRLSWNEPRMLAGEQWVGYVAFGASRAHPGALGKSQVVISTTTPFARAPQVLEPKSDTLALRLESQTAYDNIVVDVPPTATAMTIATSGSGGDIDLYVAKAPLPIGTGPGLGTAPARGLAQATSIHAGTSTEQVTVTGATLSPGRWFVTPVNASATRAAATLTIAMAETGTPPVVRDNGYFNLARGGHGLFFSDIASQWAIVWYTYLEDGSPTWYIAQAPSPAAGESVWQSPLRRFTWNGSANLGTEVGQVIVTRTGPDAFTWSWLLDGRWGSEPMQPVAARPNCPQVNGTAIDYTGGWYAPSLGGYGFSVLTLASVETEVAYLYDSRGAPRWLYAQTTPFGAGTIPLVQYRGFCPQCAAVPVQTTTVGTLTRTFTDARHGNHAVETQFAGPFVGTWSTSHATEKLTLDLGCQ